MNLNALRKKLQRQRGGASDVNMTIIDEFLKTKVLDDYNVYNYVDDEGTVLAEPFTTYVKETMLSDGEVLQMLDEKVGNDILSKNAYVFEYVSKVLPQIIVFLGEYLDANHEKEDSAFRDGTLADLKNGTFFADFVVDMLKYYLDNHTDVNIINLPDIYDKKCQEVQARCCKEREDMLENLFTMTTRLKEMQLNELKQTMKGVCAMIQTTDSVAYSQKLADTVVDLVEKAIQLNTSVNASSSSSDVSSATTSYDNASYESHTPPYDADASHGSTVSTASGLISYRSASSAVNRSVFDSPLASAPTPVDITPSDDGVDLFAIEIFNKWADAIQTNYKTFFSKFKEEPGENTESKVENIKEIIDALLSKTSALRDEEKEQFRVVESEDYDAVFTNFINLVELLFEKVGDQREELEQKLVQYKNANNDMYKFIQTKLPGLEAIEKENEGLVAFIKRVEQTEEKIGKEMEEIIDTKKCPKITDKQFEKYQKDMEALRAELVAEQAKFATASDEWSKSQNGALVEATAKHAAEMEGLRTEMAALTATNNAVMGEKDVINQQLAEKQKLLEEKHEEVTRLTQEVAEEKSRLESQNAQCEANVQGKDVEISELNTRLKDANTQSLDNKYFVQRLDTEYKQALADKEKQCGDQITDLMAEKTFVDQELVRVTNAHEKQLNELRVEMGANTQEAKRQLLQQHDTEKQALQKRTEEIEAKLHQEEDERRRLQEAAEKARAAELERVRQEAFKQEQIDACLRFVDVDEFKVVPPITDRDFKKTTDLIEDAELGNNPVDAVSLASVVTNNSPTTDDVVKNMRSFWKTYGENTFNNEKNNLTQLLTLILNKTCNGTEIKLPDLLNNKRFSYLFTILSVFILKKFEIFVGAIDKSDSKNTFNEFKCITQDKCVTNTIDIEGKSYEYDNIYLPMGDKKQYYVSATEDCKGLDTDEFCNSLYNVREITGLIDRFTTEKGTNNYLLFNYGFSGTGKTNVALGIIRLLKEKSELKEIKITHGALGKFSSPEEGFKVTLKDGKSAKGVYGKRGGEKNKYSNLDPIQPESDQKKEKTPISKTFSVKHELFIGGNADEVINAFNRQNIIKNTVDFDLYKKTMNNKKSSRFHMYYKFTHDENSLYFFDLAGSENIGDIFTHDLMDYTDKLSETDVVDTLLGSIDSVYNVLQASTQEEVVNQLVLDHGLNKSYMIKRDGELLLYTDLFRFLTKEKITTEKKSKKSVLNTRKKDGNGQTIAELFSGINGKEVQRELHILLESFYINYSLHTLQNELMNYNESSEYNLNAIPAIGLPKDLQDVKKICMFGFIRNDKLDGARDTLDFMDKLKPMMGSHPIEEDNTAAKPPPAPTMRGGGFLAPAAYVGTKSDDEVYDLMASTTMDHDTTTWFLEVISIVVFKILRVIYYEKVGNSGRTNEQFVQSKEYYHHMMKEYVATLSLSTALYIAGRTRMFYALMVDLIMSAIVMMVTKNEKITMFPLFLAVYITDFN